MSSKFPSLPLVLASMLLATFVMPRAAWAQDDLPSLGDLARTLRQNKLKQHPSGPSDTVIDNDNLKDVMNDVEWERPVRENETVFSIDPSGKTLKVSSPDVTCNLSFNARTTALIKPVLIEDLPISELLKLDGPGLIQDDNLQLQVFNGTNWDIRELTIGLTLERRPGEDAELAARARVIPAAQGGEPVAVERHSDVTLLFHLKAEAKPFSTTSFNENIGVAPGPDEDWRWSIVEAKGVRPSSGEPPIPDSLTEPLSPTPSLTDPSLTDPASATPAASSPSASRALPPNSKGAQPIPPHVAPAPATIPPAAIAPAAPNKTAQNTPSLDKSTASGPQR
ncbi:MAG: hypothetical protein WBW53_03465 [Terriglobales bacterium]